MILQKGVERGLLTNDIEGAKPKDLSVLKGRRHRDFFSDYNELNEVYNKIQDQKLNDLLNYQKPPTGDGSAPFQLGRGDP